MLVSAPLSFAVGKDAIPALSHLFLAAATPINDVLNSKESDLLSPTAGIAVGNTLALVRWFHMSISCQNNGGYWL